MQNFNQEIKYELISLLFYNPWLKVCILNFLKLNTHYNKKKSIKYILIKPSSISLGNKIRINFESKIAIFRCLQKLIN